MSPWRAVSYLEELAELHVNRLADDEQDEAFTKIEAAGEVLREVPRKMESDEGDE
jgi:hypothetical protein